MTSLLLRLPCSQALHRVALLRSVAAPSLASRQPSRSCRKVGLNVGAAASSKAQNLNAGTAAMKGYKQPGAPASERPNIAQVSAAERNYTCMTNLN